MSDKLKLVLCWHMHQPEYRDRESGEYKLPWTYLHVIKDYADMAGHLEAVPEARAVVNFAPLLLEQIEDYSNQIHCYFRQRTPIKDELLAALTGTRRPVDDEVRLKILHDCKKANRERQINRYPAFRRLIEIAEWGLANQHVVGYFSEQYFFDLLVWYHLAWLGETVKLSDERARRLLVKSGGYTLGDRLELLELIGDLLSKVLLRYRSLARQGRIELSVTPYAHPIMPLMLDIACAREAQPEVMLPEMAAYPGAKARVDWHIQKGLSMFREFFGFLPTGCWPSEGGVSEAALERLAAAGFSWTASGGSVLHNSLRESGMSGISVHQPFKCSQAQLPCFFRDDGLSDLIGFEYSKWRAEDAVADLLGHLLRIADLEQETPLVSIIMDGENAWEYFPDNGYYFLRELYLRLGAHPRIELTTFSEHLRRTADILRLPKLVAGSWVYGTFSTWVGDVDKNRAWDMLSEAKAVFDARLAEGVLSPGQLREAETQLAICEGSDWFWWFGDYNPGEAVSDFEKQFRLNLTNLYRVLGVEPPAYLALCFAQGMGAPVMGGAMRRGTEN